MAEYIKDTVQTCGRLGFHISIRSTSRA